MNTRSFTKKLALPALLLLAVVLASCGGTKAKKVAEQVVNLQIEAIKGEDGQQLEKLYQQLSTADKDEITYDNFAKKYRLPDDLRETLNLIPEASQSIEASDFQEVVTGERAEVMFSIQLPDPEKIGQDVLSLSDLLTISDKKFNTLSDLPEDIKEKIRAHATKNGVPTKKVPQTMTLVKEDDEWHIFLNLKESLAKGEPISTPFHLK